MADKTKRIERTAWVKQEPEQLISTLRERVCRLEQDLPTIEGRCQDEEWIEAVLDEIDALFRQDEKAGWRAFAPRIVEALVYSDTFWHRLVEVAQRCAARKTFSKRGQKRLRMLQKFTDSSATLEDEQALIKELRILGRRGWLAGAGYAERRAILTLQQGRFLVEEQNLHRAYEYYEKVERSLPSDGRLKEQLSEAMYELAAEFIYRKSKHWLEYVHVVKGIQLLEKIVEWYPTKSKIWCRLGMGRLTWFRLEAAITAFERAIELDPSNLYAQRGLAETYHKMKRDDLAIAIYQRASRIDPTNSEIVVGLAKIYLSQERHDLAIAVYQQAIERDKNNLLYYDHLIKLYRNQKRDDDVITVYQQKIAQSTNPSDYNNLADLYHSLDRNDEAIAVYQQLIQLEPTCARHQEGLGYFYYILKRYDEAIPIYQQLVQQEPTKMDYYQSLVNIYRSPGHVDEAIALYRSFIQFNPTSYSGYDRLGNFYKNLGRYDEAISSYQQAIQVDPTNFYVHNSLAQLYDFLKRADSAIATYQQLAEYYPTSAYVYDKLTSLYRELARVDSATSACERAVALEPNNLDLLSDLASLYCRQERYDEAIAIYERALSINPSQYDVIPKNLRDNQGKVPYRQAMDRDVPRHLLVIYMRHRLHELNRQQGRQ